GVALEELEALEGIHRVHRALQGEVDIKVLDERQRLVDEPLTFLGAQHVLRSACRRLPPADTRQEILQRLTLADVLVDGRRTLGGRHARHELGDLACLALAATLGRGTGRRLRLGHHAPPGCSALRPQYTSLPSSGGPLADRRLWQSHRLAEELVEGALRVVAEAGVNGGDLDDGAARGDQPVEALAEGELADGAG